MVTVLILTPLPVEFDAVSRFIEKWESPKVFDGAAYEFGTFTGKIHQYRIVLREPGMKNVDMALATERAIRHFNPQIVLLSGIAGGIKDVSIGDVVVAAKVYGYESGKMDTDGFKARPVAESLSADLLANAQLRKRRDDWKKRVPDTSEKTKVFIAPIAAGEKVVADINNPTWQQIKLHYNDAIALEMEAYGFATALHGHKGVQGLVVRGISDMCEGKTETDKHDWQPVAAGHAAAFLFDILYELEAPWLSNDDAPVSPPAKPSVAYPSMKVDVREEVKSIRSLISAGRIKEAVSKLVSLCEIMGQDKADLALQISGAWEAFARKERMGVMSNDEANVERAKIVSRMLSTLQDIQ